MAAEKLAVTVDYSSNNRSLRNTTFTSPDGRHTYTVETPSRYRNITSTLSMRDTQTGQTTVLAILEFKAFKPDMITLQGAQPIAVNKWMPRKNYFVWTRKYTNSTGEVMKWKGESRPWLEDSNGDVIARYHRAYFNRQPAVFSIAENAVHMLPDILAGLLVIHKDMERKRAARAG